MRMRQSIAELEQAFVEEIDADRVRREELRRKAAARSRRRKIDRAHKHGSMRFALLVVMLAATAIAVALLMFQALYVVMG